MLASRYSVVLVALLLFAGFFLLLWLAGVHEEERGLLGERETFAKLDEKGVTQVPPLEAGPCCVLSGHICGEASGDVSPHNKVKLSVVRRNRHTGSSVSVESNDDGTFRLESDPGLVTLRAEGLNCDVVDRSKEHRLILARGHPHEGIRVVTRPWAQFRGCVLLPDASPAAGASVDVTCKKTEVNMQTDENGEFAVPIPEECFVSPVISTGPVRVDAHLKAATPLYGLLFIVPDPSREDAYEVNLYEQCSVRGAVVDQAGQPKPDMGVRCTLRFRASSNQLYTHTYASTKTDEKGEFTLKGCPAGPEVFVGIVTTGGFGMRIGEELKLRPGQDNVLPPIVWTTQASPTPGLPTVF